MKNIMLILTILFLSGCGGVETIKPPADSDRKVHIDERLMQPCGKLKPIKDNPQASDVLLQHGEDVKTYKECSDSKQDLIDIIRKAFG